MSTPASSCCRTMSPTARRTRASKAAGSGRVPASSASRVVVRSWARGRLPVCVVRIRSMLSFMDTASWRPGSVAVLGDLVPVGDVPAIRVPAADLGTLEPVRDRGRVAAPEKRHDHDVLGEQVVHPDEMGRALDRVHLALGGAEEPVVLLVAPAGRVAAGPLVLLLRGLPRYEGIHEPLRVRRTGVEAVHL